MGSPKSPWRVAGDRFLADGAWHRVEDLKSAMGEEVPAGLAMRAREKNRRKWFLARKNEVTPDAASPVIAVAVGRKLVVGEATYHAIRNGSWDRDGDMIRLRPR